MKNPFAFQCKPQTSLLPQIMVALVAVFAPLASAEFRTWTNNEGRKVEAEFRGLRRELVEMLLRDGRLAEVPLASLSDADRDWVKTDETEGYIGTDGKFSLGGDSAVALPEDFLRGVESGGCQIRKLRRVAALLIGLRFRNGEVLQLLIA